MKRNKDKITVIYETNEATGEKIIKGFEAFGEVFVQRKDENIVDCFKRAHNTLKAKHNIDFYSLYTNKDIKKKKQKVENVKTASDYLKQKISHKRSKKIAAGVIAAAIALATIPTGIADAVLGKITPTVTKVFAQNKDDNNNNNKNSKSSVYTINEEDQTLKSIYKKLIKYDNGKNLVKKLEEIDDLHEDINKVAIANPDAKGKVSYIEAEELAAISDVYNSQNNKKTLLENAEEIRCNYFTGQAALINLSQGSRDVQEIDSLFKTQELKDKQIEIQNHTQETLNNLNMATPEFLAMLNEIYSNRGSNPELQSEVAFGQPGLAAALAQMTGETLENYQYAAKTDGSQLSGLINDAAKDSKRFAAEDNEINLEKQALINEALAAIDAKRLKGYDRTDFDPSTTAKGKDMVQAMIGDLGITAGGDYVVRTTTKTTTTTRKVSRAEAVKIFGESAVQKVEQEANQKLDEMTNQSQQEANQNSNDWSKGYKDGQVAFTNGGPSTASSGSAAYKRGYSEGYQHAKSVYENQVKEEDKTEETFVPENPTTENTKPTNPTTPTEPSTTTPTEPSTTIPTEEPPVIEEWVPETQSTTTPTETKQVMTIERDGVTYETEAISTSKVRSYGAVV